ncbi:YdeI/OmpD-associated family protein [Litchfieldella rifensis]|uniref:YdeI family protein n=1 Tax=Litchfieldella rifensis TaxID=762643 RepID=A0ABV7LUI9_9GAMM
MNDMNPKVDELLRKDKWQEERKTLRAILLDCQLTEEVKWGKLCYTFQKSNVVMIYGIKEYCALGFFKGALLNDADGILVKPGEHSQAMRQIRFTGVQEIDELEARLKAYIHEAIEVEKAGLKVDFKEKRELEFPEEFQDKLNEDPVLKTAFEALTPGRQRGYILHFSGAKQSRTRVSRIEKCISRILDGKGLNDR